MLFASFFWLLVIHSLQKLRPWIRNLHEQPAPKASARWSFLNKKQILLSLITTPFNKSFPSGSERNPRYHCLLRGHRKHVICTFKEKKTLLPSRVQTPGVPNSSNKPIWQRNQVMVWQHPVVSITWQCQVAFSRHKKLTRDFGRLSLSSKTTCGTV